MITKKNTKGEILAAYQELLKNQEEGRNSKETGNQEPFSDLIEYIETLKDSNLKRDVLKFFKEIRKAISILNRPLSGVDKERIYKVYREVSIVYNQLSINDILGSITTLEPLLHVFSDEPFYDSMVSVFWEIHDRILAIYPPRREVKFSEDPTAGAVCSLILMLNEDEVKKLNTFIHTQKEIYNRVNGSIK